MPAEGRFPVHRLAAVGDEAAAGIDGQIAALGRLGWSAVELRTVDGTAVADLRAGAVREVAERLAGARVRVLCLASRIGNWARPVTWPFDDDIAELDALAASCAVLKCRCVRVMSYPNDGLGEREWARRAVERVGRLAERAERLGVTLLHENCAGWAGGSGERMVRLVERVGSPALRLLFDTGNGVPYGYEAYEVLEQVLPYVAHVHVKDAVPTPDGTVYTLPGDGRARVADCLRLLLESGYQGAFSLEPHLVAVPHEGRWPGDDVSAEPFEQAGRRLRRMLDGLTGESPGTEPAAPTAETPRPAPGAAVPARPPRPAPKPARHPEAGSGPNSNSGAGTGA